MTIKKVLVVDDSATERHVLGELLAQEGFTALFAEDGQIGLSIAKLELPDLILMDVVMPGLNGFQATRAITMDPLTQHIPVIIVTAKGQETDKIWGVRQGAKDYLVKPVGSDDLLSKIAGLALA